MLSALQYSGYTGGRVTGGSGPVDVEGRPGRRDRRPIDTSKIDKLHGDVSVATRLDEYPVTKQASALRMAMDVSMQRVVEFTVGIKPPSHVLDEIRKHLRNTTIDATPDDGAEIATTAILHSMGLTESFLEDTKFDLVQADKSTQLLSIRQMNISVRYGTSTITLPVVFCSDIKGMIISWLDCIALGILHHDYPYKGRLLRPPSPPSIMQH